MERDDRPEVKCFSLKTAKVGKFTTVRTQLNEKVVQKSTSEIFQNKKIKYVSPEG